MRKPYLALFFLSLVCLFSVPSGNIFALENENTIYQPAKVYLIHPRETTQTIYLFSNQQFLTMLKSNTYFCADFHPGLNTIRFSNGKKADLLNIFEFVPGQTYYINIGDHGYHSLLNETEGLQLLKKVKTPASFNKKAEKHAFKILKRFNFQVADSAFTNLPQIPANEPRNDDPDHLQIPRFTPIKLAFANDLSSDNLRPDEPIEFQVSEDVIINNKLMIPKGTLVKGRFVRTLPPQKCGYPDFIDIIIPKIVVDEDTNIPIMGRYIQSGITKEKSVRNMKMVGYAAIILGPSGFSTIFLEVLLCETIISTIKGKSITISKGEEFTVWTRYDTYEGQILNSKFPENNVDETLKIQIPSEVIFPDIHAPFIIDSLKAYNIMFRELNKYKMGNVVSVQVFNDLKIAAYPKIGLNDNPVLICAKETNGYYLRIDLDIANNQIDKGVFQLYDPSTANLICKVEVKEALGWSVNDAVEKLLRKGTKKLFEELKKVEPTLIKE